jgi:Protein of unknown function (DUF1579)
MKRSLARPLLAVSVVVALATLAGAQGQKQPEMTPAQKAEMEAYTKAGTPGAPHQALASSAGNYDLKIKSWHEPGAAAMEDTGTARDSMSTGIMVSEGTCDSQKKTCAFTGSWNDALKKGPVRARMTTRWTSPTTEVFEMYGPGKDGKEMKMMEITYTKK